MSSLKYLKALIWFIAAYQLTVGLGLLVSPATAQLIVAWYGATVNWTPEFTFMLKPLGAYMVMTGLIAWGTARAPVPHPMISYAFAALFVINAAYRVVYFEAVRAAFGIAPRHLIVQIVTLVSLAAGCLLLQRAAQRAAQRGAAAAS